MPETTLELADFLVVRTPYMPFSTFADLVEPPVLTSDMTGEVSLPRQGERERVVQRISAAFGLPALDESLLVASPSLRQRSQLVKQSADASSKEVKTHLSLMKYFSRMCYRSTPFGLFAGVSWGMIDRSATAGAPSGIVLCGRERYRRVSRIDMGIVADLGAKLLADPDTRRGLRYCTNPTLYKTGSRWQYVESRSHVGPAQFAMSTVESTPWLDSLFSMLDERNDDALYEDIVHFMTIAAPDTSREEIEEFIESLLQNNLLLTNLQPALTGGDPFNQLRAALPPWTAAKWPAIGNMGRLVSALNELPIGTAAQTIVRIEAEAQSLLGQLGNKDVLQTDLLKPTQTTRVPRAVVDCVEQASKALLALLPNPPRRLEDFCTAFVERYGTEAVPLPEVLDPDVGIPFGSLGADELPLLAGIFPRESVRAAAAGIATSHAEDLLTRKFEEACRRQTDEIELSESDIENLQRVREAATPAAFFVVASVVECTAEAAKVVIRWAGNTSGARILGRFCLADDALAERVRGLLQAEDNIEDPDAIHAEIVHWPGGRIGNVIARPSLRAKELIIFGRGGSSKPDQINCRDVLVHVHKRRVLLRCRKSGKRIIPRLTTAHNTDKSEIAAYRFLASLQYQDAAFATFSWPEHLRKMSTLPRVVYKNCILAPREWRFITSDLMQLRCPREEDRHRVIQQWRRTLRLPRFVELIDGDHCLCTDLDNPLSVECLIDEVRHQSYAILRESFLPGSGFVRGPEGEFCHEILFPLLRKRTNDARMVMPSRRPTLPRKSPAEEKLRFLPGSDWLYLKIYSGTVGAERILAKHLYPLLSQLTGQELAQQWFFLRYRDPHEHLRLRIHGNTRDLWSVAFPMIRLMLERIYTERLTWDISIDVYQPETERYGGVNGMRIAEQIFHADSQCALTLLASEHLQDPDWRWKWMAYGTDIFWRAAGLDISARAGLYGELARQLPAAAQSKSLKVAVDKKFRAARAELDGLLFSDLRADSPVRDIFAARSHLLQPLVRQLGQMEAAGTLTRSLQEVLVSCAHMSINRLCVSANSAQEMMIYALLFRLLNGRLGRARAEMRHSHAASRG